MVEKIIKKCDEFLKFATKLEVSVVDNKDPFFSKLTELKTFSARLKLADEYFEMLGEGSSRCVYDIGDAILKIAKNDKGLAQNLEETRVAAQRFCTNRVLFADPNGKWHVMAKTKKMTRKDFKKATDMDFDDFTACLTYKLNDEGNYKIPTSYKKICENPFFRDVVQLVIDCGLQLGDLRKINSWGKYDNKVVLTDTGLTREVWDKHYES